MLNSSSNLPVPVTEALGNAVVANLYKAIDTLSRISFEPSKDDTWGSSTTPEGTTIEWCVCNHPTEALAHELLHAQFKLSGYRQHSFVVAKAPCPHRAEIRRLLGILDNELQHHRMVQRFTEMGFDKKFFYNDSDVGAMQYVRKELKKMSAQNTVADFFTLFVTVISPGGGQSELKRNQAKSELRLRAGAKNTQILDAVETIFSSWRDSSSTDHRHVLQQVMTTVFGSCTYWVGASESFPDDGFFVGSPFGPQDAERG